MSIKDVRGSLRVLLRSVLVLIVFSVGALRASAELDGISHVSLNGMELVDRFGCGSVSEDGDFVLDSGESAELVLDAPCTFRSVGFWCEGELDGAMVRVLHADGSADRSYPVVESDDLSPEMVGSTGLAGDSHIGALVHTYGKDGIGVRLSVVGPVRLASLSFVFIERSEKMVKPEPAFRFVEHDHAMKVDGGGDDEQEPQDYPKPFVNSRESWNADPWWCDPWYCTTTHIGIHHTASASEFYSSSWSECAGNVKAIQAYHMYSRGWCDIGYNYLICVHGQIWEGRDGGDNIGGAHDGYNCGSMGVSFMGYFHEPYYQTLTPAMFDAIGELGAWKCDQQSIDPWGSAWYSGYGGMMSTVYGHRDVSSTACPGDLVYAEMNTIRGEIDDRLQGGGTDIVLDNPQAVFIGDWATSSAGDQTYGSDYRWRSTGIEIGYAYWSVQIPESGTYDLYYWWTDGGNRNPQTVVGVRVGGSTYTTMVNQQVYGGQWNHVGSGHFGSGTHLLVGLSTEGPGGYVVVADAARLVRR